MAAVSVLSLAATSFAASKSFLEIQQALLAQGFNPGVVDGVWGKKSSNALRAFQKARGLKSTGIIDDRTVEFLFPTPTEIHQRQPSAVADTALKGNSVAEEQTLPDLRQAVTKTQTVEQRRLIPEAATSIVKSGRSGRDSQKPDSLLASTAEPATISPTAPAESYWDASRIWASLVGAVGALVLVLASRRKSKRRGLADDAQIVVEAVKPLVVVAPTISAVEGMPVAVASGYSLARHNAAVDEWVVENASKAASNKTSEEKRPSPIPSMTVVTLNSLARHNAAVDEWVTENATKTAADSASVEPLSSLKTASISDRLDPMSEGAGSPSNDDEPVFLVIQGETVRDEAKGRPTTNEGWAIPVNLPFHGEPAVPDHGSSLAKHSASVKQWIIDRGRTVTPSETERPPSIERPKTSGPWLPVGVAVTVSSITIRRGMIYVGKFLPKQGVGQQNENCLIDPSLRIASYGDPSGRSMYYWPSYSELSQEARRSYLEWLAGSRSDPDTYIGYVFLYFYGLERRLMLEPDSPDETQVIAEVRRLRSVYGWNNSFQRYATELLNAVTLRRQAPSEQDIRLVEPTGYEVPTAIKLALGNRLSQGRDIEPDLLLRFVMTHPETRVRTPAKRAPELLEKLFALHLTALYPNGLRVKGGRFKKIKKHYRACSGTFEIDVPVFGGDVPDITDRAEPITTARRLFDACSDQLDEYSRAIGKLPGLQPNLGAVAKLPRELRREIAMRVPGDPLTKIEELAGRLQSAQLADLAEIAGIEVGPVPTKPKLRELGNLLAAFGLGVTCDPRYAPKNSAAHEHVVIFAVTEEIGEASDAYRAVQLSVMLGIIVGHADGHFHDLERSALIGRITTAAGISSDERRRLEAEVSLYEANPARLDDWVKKLKDVPRQSREVIAGQLIATAAADGSIHADEVKKLEVLFKRMGLDHARLYDQLHANLPRSAEADDDGLSFIVPPGGPVAGAPIQQPPADKPAIRIDLSALKTIRSETRVTASVLADIFAEDEDLEVTPTAIVEADEADNDIFDGLERRYGVLLLELSAQSSWPRDSFEQIVRAAGLMSGAAREAINDWSLDRFDELVIEGDDPVEINSYLLPPVEATANSHSSLEGTNA
ncbi:spore cortex-lytic enzyme [compost metagenome]